MSVEMALNISASCSGLSGPGTINLTVALTNKSNSLVGLSANAFQFTLIDQSGNDVPGFEQPGLQQTGGQPGGLQFQFRRVLPGGETVQPSFNFTAPSVQVGPIYTLVSCFPETQDVSTQTFTFVLAAQSPTP
jgi:hypothetical protein